MKEQTLVDILAKLDEVAEGLLCDQDEGEAPLSAELERLLTSLEEKIDGYGHVHQRLKLEAVAVEAQLMYLKERYERRLVRIKNQMKQLEDRLLSYHASGILADKQKGKVYSLTFRNYPVVELDVAVENLPEEFKQVKTEVKPKLNEIKKAIKDDPHCRNIGCMAHLEDNYKVVFK